MEITVWISCAALALYLASGLLLLWTDPEARKWSFGHKAAMVFFGPAVAMFIIVGALLLRGMA